VVGVFATNHIMYLGGALRWTGGLDESKGAPGWTGDLDNPRQHRDGPMAWMSPREHRGGLVAWIVQGSTGVDWWLG
jgi:hypothetical protein